MPLLPANIRAAIDDSVGHSPDQFGKATRDAEKLYHEYGLAPEQWDEAAITGMAEDLGWSQATLSHRMGIIMRVVAAFRTYHRTGDSGVITRDRQPDISVEAISSGEPVRARLSMESHWEPVLSGAERQYSFAEAPSDYLRAHYSRPAIYRWILPATMDEPTQYYVGETVNLTRRVEQYRHPGHLQRTNQRLHDSLNRNLNAGVRPELQLLTACHLLWDGQRLEAQDLSDWSVRVRIEQTMITLHLLSGCHLLNGVLERRMME